MTLAIVIARQISPLIQEQLDQIQEESKIALDVSQLTATDSDNDMIKSMKKHLLDNRTRHAENLGQYGAKIIGAAIDKENCLVAQARALRAEADSLLSQAHTLRNARSFLLTSGDVIPVAKSLGLVPSSHAVIATKYIDSLTIPDVFAEAKAKKKPR